jgi:hypothetical protein
MPSLTDQLIIIRDSLNLQVLSPKGSNPVTLKILPPPTTLSVTNIVTDSVRFLSKDTKFNTGPSNLVDDIQPDAPLPGFPGTVGKLDQPLPLNIPIRINAEIEVSKTFLFDPLLTENEDYVVDTLASDLISLALVPTFSTAKTGSPGDRDPFFVRVKVIVAAAGFTVPPVILTVPVFIDTIRLPSVALIARHHDFDPGDNRDPIWPGAVLILVPKDSPFGSASALSQHLTLVRQILWPIRFTTRVAGALLGLDEVLAKIDFPIVAMRSVDSVSNFFNICWTWNCKLFDRFMHKDITSIMFMGFRTGFTCFDRSKFRGSKLTLETVSGAATIFAYAPNLRIREADGSIQTIPAGRARDDRAGDWNDVISSCRFGVH